MYLLGNSFINSVKNSVLIQEPVTTFQMIPDRTVRPWNVENFTRALHELYLPPVKRIESWKPLKFRLQESFTFTTILTADKINFYFSLPQRWASYVKGKASLCYPRATIIESELPQDEYIYTADMTLRKHDFYALESSSRDYKPLGAILENVRDLNSGEKIVIQTIATPLEREDWARTAQEAYRGHVRGEQIERVALDVSTALESILRSLDGAITEAADFISYMIGQEKEKEIKIPGERDLSGSTIRKMSSPPFVTQLKVMARSEDLLKARILVKSVCTSFNEIAGDNEFAMKEPTFLPYKFVLSSSELAKLLQLPGAELQNEYPQIEQIQRRESRLPKLITEKGLLIGHTTRQRQDIPVYLPTSSVDELCLPHVVIGGMGTGKTKGFGANMMVEAVRNGYGAICIDPERGEIGDEVESVLKPNQVIRVRFGNNPISIDWREALHSPRSRNRLANEIVSFFEAQSDEAGAQTLRFLRSAAKVVPNGSLDEVIKVFVDDNFREQLLKTMPENERITWEQYHMLTDARKNQLSIPVLNRLDVIEGDDYLHQCMNSKVGLDFVRLLDTPKAIILDVPKSLLGREAADILGSLLSTKIDLAMTLRKSTFPVFVVQDEPHQYLRSARIWRSAAVESRKWRFGYTWMFHAWEQIPRDLAAIIQASGPHYHIYRTSKATYKSLEEEIKPFEIEEAMETPLYYAINVIRAGGRTVTPFLAKMLKPPSMRKEDNDEKPAYGKTDRVSSIRNRTQVTITQW